ncbi:hypothetical protein HNY73_011506 [Argiope bruennichi]|uniref:Uncharacterized protein n=1 Tax=Argiope bruennichi TaxID=94029 RepID=A0A8T0F9G3_ARGBR|nr:hypothetical protein HNY73_011506 [Argiope bruennichi]
MESWRQMCPGLRWYGEWSSVPSGLVVVAWEVEKVGALVQWGCLVQTGGRELVPCAKTREMCSTLRLRFFLAGFNLLFVGDLWGTRLFQSKIMRTVAHVMSTGHAIKRSLTVIFEELVDASVVAIATSYTIIARRTVPDAALRELVSSNLCLMHLQT